MFTVLITCLVAQRLLELALSERNRRWALRQGGAESGRGHYRIIVAVHVAFLISLVIEHDLAAPGWNEYWPLWLAILICLMAVRVWIIVTLGHYWNTRIVTIPGMKLVSKGPYRFVRHPNYLVVALEFVVIPVLCRAYLTAFIFSIANALILSIRIREEERALNRCRQVQ